MRIRALAFGIMLSLSSSIPAWAQSGPSSVEYQLKAAFLLNFAKFVEWPPEAYQNDKSPITLCVFGHDPFGGVLDDIIRGRTINNRDVAARRVTDISDLKSCQLVFVDVSENKRLPDILSILKGTSALLVGDADGFAARGGDIEFFLESNKLRFAINVDAIQRTHLMLSSKLLALAKIVHDDIRQKAG